MKTVITTTIKPHDAAELSLNVSQGIHPPFQTEYRRTLPMSSQKLEDVQLSESKDELWYQAKALKQLACSLQYQVSALNKEIERLEKELQKVDHSEIDALRETNEQLTAHIEHLETMNDLHNVRFKTSNTKG